jgi:hypothetical protein
MAAVSFRAAWRLQSFGPDDLESTRRNEVMTVDPLDLLWLGLAIFCIPFVFGGLALLIEVLSGDSREPRLEGTASHVSAPEGHVDG